MTWALPQAKALSIWRVDTLVLESGYNIILVKVYSRTYVKKLSKWQTQTRTVLLFGKLAKYRTTTSQNVSILQNNFHKRSCCCNATPAFPPRQYFSPSSSQARSYTMIQTHLVLHCSKLQQSISIVLYGTIFWPIALSNTRLIRRKFHWRLVYL